MYPLCRYRRPWRDILAPEFPVRSTRPTDYSRRCTKATEVEYELPSNMYLPTVLYLEKIMAWSLRELRQNIPVAAIIKPTVISAC